MKRLAALALAFAPLLPAVASAQAVLHLPDGFEAVEMTGNDETLSCMKGGAGDAVMLLHGWPETANEWDGVATILADTHTVYACDLPGVRASTNVDDDFTKADMAGDIHAALSGAGIGPVHMVGHDIGLMVAYAYASAFPDDVRTLTVIDAPLPGTPVYDMIAADPRAWHFAFHIAPEVPERIVANDVEYYVGHFIRSLWATESVSPDKAIAGSAAAYADPETLRAGFEFYRAFAQDAQDNAAKMEAKLPMPVLALNAGALSPQPYVLMMMQTLADDVRGGAIEGAGHWLPHEVTDDLATRIGNFLRDAAQ